MAGWLRILKAMHALSLEYRDYGTDSQTRNELSLQLLLAKLVPSSQVCHGVCVCIAEMVQVVQHSTCERSCRRCRLLCVLERVDVVHV